MMVYDTALEISIALDVLIRGTHLPYHQPQIQLR